MTQAINFFSDEDNLSSEAAFDPWRKLASDWLFNFNSARTRDNYRRAVLFFFRFADLHPEKVRQSEILRFRYEMESHGYSEGTINQRLAAVSSFFALALERGLRADNPADGVKRKAVNPYGKATFLEEEQDLKLLNAIDKTTAKGKRDYAILLIFLTTAVRVDAVANLRMKDFRQQGDTVFMQYRNKGGEVVEKKLQPLVIEAVVDYLDARSDMSPDSPVFVATEAGKRGIAHLHGEQEGEKLLSSRSIQRMVQDYADQAFGKGHRITPHSLRHTAAMNAITSGASVIEVSRLLRHKNMRVTTIYVQHVSDKADEAVSEKLAKRYLESKSK